MKNDNITSNLHELREANSARERGRELPDRLSDQNLPVWNLRVKFQKIGRLQFISHLDLARTMRTAIVRARNTGKIFAGLQSASSYVVCASAVGRNAEQVRIYGA